MQSSPSEIIQVRRPLLRHKGGPVVARTLNVQLEWEYNVLQTHHQMVAFLNQGVCDQLLLYFLISPPLCVCACIYACIHACIYVYISGVHACHSVHLEVGGQPWVLILCLQLV